VPASLVSGTQPGSATPGEGNLGEGNLGEGNLGEGNLGEGNLGQNTAESVGYSTLREISLAAGRLDF
jgi:Pentapeptide repeats (8 copies)